MEELGFDNLLSDIDIDNLFGGQEDDETKEETGGQVSQEEGNDVSKARTSMNNEDNDIADVDPNDLFGGLQESVGDEE